MPPLCWMRKSSQGAVMDRRAALRMRTGRGIYSRVQSRPWWSANWEVTLTTWTPRGICPHTMGSQISYWMLSTCLKSESHLEPFRRSWRRAGRAGRGSGWGVCKESTLARRRGSYLAAGELRLVNLLSRGTTYMWIDISVAILWNKAGGRLLLYEHARVSEGKAVAFSTMLQKKFFWFLYLKEKKQAAFRWVGASF